MTQATVETIDRPVDARLAAANEARVTQWRVIVAEWIKFTSLRSNRIALGGGVVAVLLLGWLAAGVASGSIVPDNPLGIEGPDLSTILDATAIATGGVALAVLVLGSLGVLAMSGEYSSGMIRSTLAAVPSHLRVLWAKSAVLLAVTIVTMTAAIFASFFITGAVLADTPMTANLSDPGVLRALLGNVGYVAGIVLLGLSLGVLLRSSAGGIATLFATFLVAPQLITLILPDRIVDVIYGYLPSNAAMSFTFTEPAYALGAMGRELLGVAHGTLVFVAWIVVGLAAAAFALARRDA